MNFIQDIIMTNKNLIPKSIKSTTKNWKIFLVGIAYAAASIIMWRVAANAWILGGIVITLFQSAVISDYLYLIENIVSYDRFTMYDFKSGFPVYLRKIYTILILIWLVQYGASLFLRPIFSIRIGSLSLWFLVQLIAFILLNPLPETIYQKHYDGLYSISYAFDFIKENWLEWFIPNIVVFAIGYLIHIFAKSIVAILSINNPVFFLNFILQIIVYSIFYQLIIAFAMIYRGHLFNILSTSTRRKRMFMRDMYR